MCRERENHFNNTLRHSVKARRPHGELLAAIMDARSATDLQALYEELHRTCERAATLLRLSSYSEASDEDTLAEFRKQQDKAAELWHRISNVQGF